MIVDVQALSKQFRVGNQWLNAVQNVSFQLVEGETFGVVGESGCGKSTLAKLLVRLEKPTTGQILFRGEHLSFSRHVQMIFQDPFSSLDPRMTVGDLIREPLIVHKLPTQGVAEKLIEQVGMNQGALQKFPHAFSGGQRQRIGIARALALNPKVLICDEPLSSLDMSTAAQVVSLLQTLQRELKLTYLFITHDLSMIRTLAHSLCVMYLGSIVEMAPATALFKAPLHPYTQMLIASIPIADPILERKRVRIPPLGEPPSPLRPPPGCPFSNRCPKAMPLCHQVAPKLEEKAPGHKVACHLY